MGRGSGEGTGKGRSQLDSKSRQKSKMYRGRGRGQGQGSHGGRGGYGHGRGRGGGGGRGGYSGGGGGNWNRKLFENMSGFLCSCNMNEKDCTKEALNLLNEYLRDEDVVRIGEVPSTASGSNVAQEAGDTGNMDITQEDQPKPEASGEGDGESKEEEDDIEAELKAEIRELKSDAVRSRFFSVDTGVPNLVFIKSTVSDPQALARRIFEDILNTKELKARFLLRLIPIEMTCMAKVDQIEGVCRKIFPKYFGGNFTTFQVVYKSRYNGNIDRSEVIKLLANLVCEINPLNVVDLTNPTYSIIVEVIRNIICIGVVKDYNKFKRYNLHEILVDESEKKTQSGTTPVTASTDENVSVQIQTSSDTVNTETVDEAAQVSAAETQASEPKLESD